MRIHTMQLMASLTLQQYYDCRDMFYTIAKGRRKCCYLTANVHTFNYWSYKGVQITLKKSQGNFGGAYLSFRINPSRLLGVTAPYALYEVTEENNQLLIEALEEIMVELPAKIDVNSLSLMRLDICEDFRLDWSDVLLYINLLQKGVHDPQWKEIGYEDERRTHSFRRANKRYQITAYDKVYQMRKEKLMSTWSEEFHLLRLEAALFRDGIQHLIGKFCLRCNNWNTMLLEMAENRGKIFRHVLLKLLPEGHYYSLNEARAIIQESHFHQNKKEALIDFIEGLNNSRKPINLYEVRQSEKGKKRLLQLQELQINPVTIPYRKSTKVLPSIFSLIEPSLILADEVEKMNVYCSLE